MLDNTGLLLFWATMGAMAIMALWFASGPLWLGQKTPRVKPSLCLTGLLILGLGMGLLSYSTQPSYEQLQRYYALDRLQQILKELSRKPELTPEIMIETLNQASTNLPDYIEVKQRLADIFYGLGFYQQSGPLFQQLYQTDPDNHQARLRYAYGDSLLNYGQLSVAAREQVHYLFTLNPTDRMVLNLMAMDAFQQADYALAIQIWQAMLDNHEVLMEAAERTAVTKALDKALRLKEENPLPNDS
jgi:cytochrome c-type biogenesis protein CcmH/NrfG